MIDLENMKLLLLTMVITGAFLIGFCFYIIYECAYYYQKTELQNAALKEIKIERDNLYQENRKYQQAKDNLHRENGDLHREYQQAKNDLHRENVRLLTQCKDLKFEFAEQSRTMGDLMIDYLKASHSLHARGIFEKFQTTFVSPRSDKSRKKTRFAKWKDFANSDDEKVKSFEKVLVNTRQSLPETAVELYSHLNNGIHSYHNNASSNIFLVKTELSPVQLEFLMLLCQFLQCTHKVKVCESLVDIETCREIEEEEIPR